MSAARSLDTKAKILICEKKGSDSIWQCRVINDICHWQYLASAQECSMVCCELCTTFAYSFHICPYKVLPAGPNGPGPSAQPAQVFCVNPGRLSKGTSGGTFSYIQSTASQEADGRMNPTKVEIIRI